VTDGVAVTLFSSSHLQCGHGSSIPNRVKPKIIA